VEQQLAEELQSEELELSGESEEQVWQVVAGQVWLVGAGQVWQPEAEVWQLVVGAGQVGAGLVWVGKRQGLL